MRQLIVFSENLVRFKLQKAKDKYYMQQDYEQVKSMELCVCLDLPGWSYNPSSNLLSYSFNDYFLGIGISVYHKDGTEEHLPLLEIDDEKNQIKSKQIYWKIFIVNCCLLSLKKQLPIVLLVNEKIFIDRFKKTIKLPRERILSDSIDGYFPKIAPSPISESKEKLTFSVMKYKHLNTAKLFGGNIPIKYNGGKIKPKDFQANLIRYLQRCVGKIEIIEGDKRYIDRFYFNDADSSDSENYFTFFRSIRPRLLVDLAMMAIHRKIISKAVAQRILYLFNRFNINENEDAFLELIQKSYRKLIKRDTQDHMEILIVVNLQGWTTAIRDEERSDSSYVINIGYSLVVNNITQHIHLSGDCDNEKWLVFVRDFCELTTRDSSISLRILSKDAFDQLLTSDSYEEDPRELIIREKTFGNAQHRAYATFKGNIPSITYEPSSDFYQTITLEELIIELNRFLSETKELKLAYRELFMLATSGHKPRKKVAKYILELEAIQDPSVLESFTENSYENLLKLAEDSITKKYREQAKAERQIGPRFSRM